MSLTTAKETPAQSGTRLIEPDTQPFPAYFNRRAYEFRHRLAAHSLFELGPLMELTRRVAQREDAWGPYGDVYWDLGPKDISAGAHEGPRSMTVEDAIRRIMVSDAWVFVKHIEREPGYRHVLETCICDCLELSGRNLLKKIKWFEAILFITSPGRVTPYHIDRECSWLLQISGSKWAHVFDRNDRVVTSEQELEAYWRGAKRGQYKPDLENRAERFHLRPGTGIHIPVNAPHWLQNDKNVSISLNVNFQFHESELGDLYRANYFLRRLGLKPKHPGAAPWRDHIKRFCMRLAFAPRRRQSQTRLEEIRVQREQIGRLMSERRWGRV